MTKIKKIFVEINQKATQNLVDNVETKIRNRFVLTFLPIFCNIYVCEMCQNVLVCFVKLAYNIV